MTQDDLQAWCEAHNCYVYDTKDNDHGHSIAMRRNDVKTLMAILFEPKKNGGIYKAASVCHICNTLQIPVPDFGQPMQSVLNEAKANCPKH